VGHETERRKKKASKTPDKVHTKKESEKKKKKEAQKNENQKVK
jgi:hypothetical protein